MKPKLRNCSREAEVAKQRPQSRRHEAEAKELHSERTIRNAEATEAKPRWRNGEAEAAENAKKPSTRNSRCEIEAAKPRRKAEAVKSKPKPHSARLEIELGRS